MRILLVEDNTRLAETIAKGLREQSFAVDIAFDGENALETACRFSWENSTDRLFGLYDKLYGESLTRINPNF